MTRVNGMLDSRKSLFVFSDSVVFDKVFTAIRIKADMLN